jgi:hypothetical protein
LWTVDNDWVVTFGSSFTSEMFARAWKIFKSDEANRPLPAGFWLCFDLSSGDSGTTKWPASLHDFSRQRELLPRCLLSGSEALIARSFDLSFIKTGLVAEPQLQAQHPCQRSALALLDEAISNLHRVSL